MIGFTFANKHNTEMGLEVLNIKRPILAPFR